MSFTGFKWGQYNKAMRAKVPGHYAPIAPGQQPRIPEPEVSSDDDTMSLNSTQSSMPVDGPGDVAGDQVADGEAFNFDEG